MACPNEKIVSKVDAVAQHTFRPTCHLQGVPPECNNPYIHSLSFHSNKGVSINFDASLQKATRDQSGISHGFVFTEKAIKRNHKVLIEIDQVVQGHESGLAFGVTTCDPATITPANFPQDFSDLAKMPLYWIGNNFNAGEPAAQSVISFWITDDGEFKYEKDTDGARTAFRILDSSRKFYMFFDVHGSTLSIKLKGIVIIPRADLPAGSDSRERSLRIGGSEQPLFFPQHPSANLVAPAWPAMPAPGPQMPSIGSYSETSLTPAALATFFPRGYSVPPMAFPRTPIGFSPYTLASRPTSYSKVMAPLPFIPPPPPTTFQKTDLSNTSGAALTTDEEDVCITCVDAPINSVFDPCGHTCMCYECAGRLKGSKKLCPLCRAKIKKVIKTFKS